MDAKREAQFRGSLLTHARLKKSEDADGWLTGLRLMVAARDGDRRQFEAASDAERLLGDLVEMRLLEEKAQPIKGIGVVELAHRKFRVTRLGLDLCYGNIDAIPGVDL